MTDNPFASPQSDSARARKPSQGALRLAGLLFIVGLFLVAVKALVQQDIVIGTAFILLVLGAWISVANASRTENEAN
jgi:hypothetical protein